MKLTRNAVFAACLSVTGMMLPYAAQAITADSLQTLSDAWATGKYHQQGPDQTETFDKLLGELDGALSDEPSNTELKVLKATTLSTYASIQGGLEALKKVEKARDLLEEVIASTDSFDTGMAYGVLGSLYANVPRWPIAFKNTKKAEKYLRTGVELAPESLDAHYYLAKFLNDQKRYAEAEKYYLNALETPHRTERFIADEARREEAERELEAMLKAWG